MAERGPNDERERERELERRRQQRLALAPLLVGLLGGLGSVWLWRTLRGAEQQGARSVFELSASQRAAGVQRERTAAFEQLRSVGALFDSSDEVLAEEFRTFTAKVLERNAALRELLWIELDITPGALVGRVAFAQGAERATLAPGLELEPLSEVGQTLTRAVASGDTALSGPLWLSETEGPRVLVALPVRRHAEGRVGELHGCVALLLDTGRLSVPGANSAAPAEVALRIEDITGSRPVLLAGNAGDGALEYSPADEELGGRRWRITCSAPPGFLARNTSAWPLLALLLGLVGTGSVSIALVMITSRQRAQALVERRSGEVLQSYATLASEAEERRHATREAKESQEQLRQILDLVPNQIYVKDRHGRMLMANQATAEALGASVRELTLSADVDVNADVGPPSEELREDRVLMLGDKSVLFPAKPFVDAQGRRRILQVAKIPCRMQGGPALLHVATDVTERRQAEDVVRSQNLLLGELARGAPPEEVLQHVVETAEKLVSGLRCSVLFLAPDRRHLGHGIAPSLPEEYSRAIEGLEIGPLAGSCGAAAHLGQRFIVKDVLQHPNWAAYRDLARRANIRACWSEPIRAIDGEILGTFAMYYAEPRAPEPYEERFIESMAYLAGIAIERGHLGATT